MSDEFFKKLNKGMNIENEVAFTSTPIAKNKESKKKKPAKKRAAKKKTDSPRQLADSEKKPSAVKKIKVKQEPFLEEEINQDVFQKEGQLTVDVFETDKNIIIQSAVAGIEPDDLDISIEKDMVTIKGKRERKIEEQVENYFYQECFWGRFTREIALPSEVDKNKAEASMKNGVLTIKIPKTK